MIREAQTVLFMSIPVYLTIVYVCVRACAPASGGLVGIKKLTFLRRMHCDEVKDSGWLALQTWH